LGQKIKDTLAFNHRVVAQNIFTFMLFNALEPRSFYSHQSPAQAYKANKQAKLKTIHQSKESFSNNALKDRLD
jgi:hypothetical protein